MGLEFSSQKTFRKDDLDTLFPSDKNVYRSGPQDRQLGIPWLGQRRRRKSISATLSSLTKDRHALFALATKIFLLSGRDGVAIYRIDPEDAARGPILACFGLAGAQLPDGTIAKEPWKRKIGSSGHGTTKKATGRPQEDAIWTIAATPGQSEDGI